MKNNKLQFREKNFKNLHFKLNKKKKIKIQFRMKITIQITMKYLTKYYFMKNKANLNKIKRLKKIYLIFQANLMLFKILKILKKIQSKSILKNNKLSMRLLNVN